MKDIYFEALHDELCNETLLDFFKQEGIKDIDYLKRDYYIDENECENCGSKGTFKANFDYMYKYDSEKRKLIRCAEGDDDVIYDFVFYVCERCNSVNYFIIIAEQY